MKGNLTRFPSNGVWVGLEFLSDESFEIGILINIKSGPGDGSQQRDIIGLFPGDLKNGSKDNSRPSIFIFLGNFEFNFLY